MWFGITKNFDIVTFDMRRFYRNIMLSINEIFHLKRLDVSDTFADLLTRYFL